LAKFSPASRSFLFLFLVFFFFILNHFGCTRVQTGRAATVRLVDVVIGCVAGHLANGARIAPEGAATIFTRTARLRFDIVLVAQFFTGLERRNAGEDGEHDCDDVAEVNDRFGPSGITRLDRVIVLSVRDHFLSCRDPDRVADEVEDDVHDHHGEPELVRAGIDLAAAVGRTHPRELVARQDLAEQTATAPTAEAADWVAATELKAVAPIVAPTTGRNGMATTATTSTTDRDLLHNNRIEPLASLYSGVGLVVGEDVSKSSM
jgi:hypothetical protein